MSTIRRMVACGGWILLAAAGAKADSFYYAHPELADLSKDLNATSTGGANPSVVNSYIPNTQDDFRPNSGTQTYQLNLGYDEAIGLINFEQIGQAGFAATAWTIDWSLNGTLWHNVATGTSASDPMTGNAAGAVARFVRLQATAFQANGLNQWDIRHVQVYGAPGVPIAIRNTLNIGGQPSNNATATISGPAVGGNVDTNPANNRTDEAKINDLSADDGTFGLNGGDGLGSPGTLPRDITYTFDSEYLMKGIRWTIFPGRGGLMNYQVFTSLGGGPESLVDTNTLAVNGEGPYDAFDGNDGIFGKPADKVRIHVTSYSSTDSMFPSEIEVFGDAIPEPATGGMLLALGVGAGLVRRRR